MLLIKIILRMIRLISLKIQEPLKSTNKLQPHTSFISNSKSQSTSTVKLGQRRQRLNTIQVAKNDDLNKSLKMKQTESQETSYIDRSPEVNKKIESSVIENTPKKHNY
jgi:hypothetical protein